MSNFSIRELDELISCCNNLNSLLMHNKCGASSKLLSNIMNTLASIRVDLELSDWSLSISKLCSLPHSWDTLLTRINKDCGADVNSRFELVRLATTCINQLSRIITEISSLVDEEVSDQ